MPTSIIVCAIVFFILVIVVLFLIVLVVRCNSYYELSKSQYNEIIDDLQKRLKDNGLDWSVG